MLKKKEIRKELSTSVKGVQDMEESKYFAYQGLFEKASEIALYYGFKPIELPTLEKEILYTESIGKDTCLVEKEMFSFKIKRGEQVALRPEGSPGIMRAYFEHNMRSNPQPVMLYYYGSFFRNNKQQKLRESKQFGIEILGTSKSIADATVIKIATTILKEAGLKNIRIQINSIGDKESRQSYIKELSLYYRKNIADLCPTCREHIKTNPFQILLCKNDNCQNINTKAPDSISFLTTTAKKHFREVLEYLDAMDISYEIDNSLVRGSNFYNQTVFKIIENPPEEVKEETEEKVEKETKEGRGEGSKNEKNTKQKDSIILAKGGRYDYLAKHFGYKKEVPSVNATIEIDNVINSLSHKPISPRICKKPKIYFIQLGFEAKLKSLAIIEILRQAHIPMTQSLAKDRLSSQLAVVEKLHIPYAIILGQREALDNTVIIRNMNTHSQETIPIDKLAEYIKKKLK